MGKEVNSQESKMVCMKCNLHLTLDKVTLSYMGNCFPVDLYKCPQCGMVFIPEDLVRGKMEQAEKVMEDK
jgi:hypothetical protein